MTFAEHQPRNQIAKCNIRCTGNGPPADQMSGAEEYSAEHIQASRPHNAAERGDERSSCLFRRRKSSAWQESFPDFLGCNRKEKAHQYVVNNEMKTDVRGSFSMNDVMVRFMVNIGKYEGSNRPSNQKQTIFKQKSHSNPHSSHCASSFCRERSINSVLTSKFSRQP